MPTDALSHLTWTGPRHSQRLILTPDDPRPTGPGSWHAPWQSGWYCEVERSRKLCYWRLFAPRFQGLGPAMAFGHEHGTIAAKHAALLAVLRLFLRQASATLEVLGCAAATTGFPFPPPPTDQAERDQDLGARLAAAARALTAIQLPPAEA